MEELLKNHLSKKIDVSCGTTAVFRGRVADVKDGALYLVDEDDRRIFLSVAKIAWFCECSDSATRPGFIG